MQSTDEREYRYILTADGNLGKLVLEVANIGFEAVILPHLDGEEVMVVLLNLPTRCVLSEERFSYLLKVAERMR